MNEDFVSEAEIAAEWEQTKIAQDLRQRMDELTRLSERCATGSDTEKAQSAAELCVFREKVRTELSEQ